MIRQARLVWLLLALVTSIVMGETWTRAWLLALGVPWLLGAALLWTRGDRIAEGGQAVRGAPRAGTLGVILGFLTLLLAHLLQSEGAVGVLLWGGAAWLCLASFAGPPRTARLTIGASVAMISACATLGAAEVALRLVPGAAGRVGDRETVVGGPGYDQAWEGNVFGFRSRHERIDKDSTTVRLLALGDSFTWGARIARTEDAWPGRLEPRLSEEYPGRRIEVWNLSESGFTTANEAELLRRLGWQLNPDLVIVQFYINDALPSRPNFGHEPSTWLFRPRWLLPYRMRDAPIASSRVFRLMRKSYTEYLNRGISWRQLYAPESSTWAEIEAAVRDLGAQAGQRGVPLVFMLFPVFEPGEWTVETYPFRDEYSRVALVAREAGLATLDLTPVFADSGGDWRRWWVTETDGHPDPTAHAMAAEELLRLIRGEGLIDE